MRRLALTLLLAATARAFAQPTPSPAPRADALLARMTLDEKLALVRALPGYAINGAPKPTGAIGSAGYQPPIARLGVPAIQQTDAGQGVGWVPDFARHATAMPSALAVAASFDPRLARAGGAMIGGEARAYGFGMLLAGAMNLTREPRNGRNFEYLGEDPWLAGVIGGAIVQGIQSARIMSTVKHFALNAQETGRTVLSADIGEAALRESDLLAFEIAIERGRPASVMTSYNRLNGVYTAENATILGALKMDWGFAGFVMPDWEGIHSTVNSVNAGLDQESASDADYKKAWFGKPLRDAVASGRVSRARLDDMAGRVLRAMERTGTLDPITPHPIDFAADGVVSQHAAEAGAVLLKNAGGVLPLAKTTRRIAVIGGYADVGVMSGGGSGQVVGPAGVAFRVKLKDQPDQLVLATSPLEAMRQLAPGATISFTRGDDPAAAARAAAAADVAVVFADQWTSENIDAPDLKLPRNQDATIAAVAAANPRTVVVLETGGPVTMPWLAATPAVLETWFPGSNGGQAIARLLFGDAQPSGRLPITFPASEAQLPRPGLDGVGLPDGTRFDVDYTIEGADVGYKWHARRGTTPLFAFGHGLTYTSFAYSGLRVTGMSIDFDVTNTGARAGTDTPQAYVDGVDGIRLVGFGKVRLGAGERAHVHLTIDPRLLARFDTAAHGWHVAPGTRRVRVGASTADLRFAAPLTVAEARLRP